MIYEVYWLYSKVVEIFRKYGVSVEGGDFWIRLSRVYGRGNMYFVRYKGFRVGGKEVDVFVSFDLFFRNGRS